MPAVGTGPVGEWGIAPGQAATGGPGPLAETGTVAALRQLAAVPEEGVWLASQRSAATRRAYRADVEHFLRDLGIADRRELRLLSRAAVVAWIRSLDARGRRGQRRVGHGRGGDRGRLVRAPAARRGLAGPGAVGGRQED